jgi:hypothetical protein
VKGEGGMGKGRTGEYGRIRDKDGSMSGKGRLGRGIR